MVQEKQDNIQFFSLRSQKLLMYVLLITPLIYVLILLEIQIVVLRNNIFLNWKSLPFFILLLSSVFGLMSFVIILQTYLFFIPFAQKTQNLSEKYKRNVLVLAYGAEIIGLFGLIIGVIGYKDYDTIYWFIILPFLMVAFFHGIYLYIFKIKPSFSKSKNS